MEIIDAIHKRHSVGKMKPDPVPREVIEELLSAAAQAPNHYKVRPWRFVVLTGPGRERLGEVMAEVFHRKFPDVKPEALDKERLKPLRSPLLIAVGVDRPADPRVLQIENVCAAAAACENTLLAALEFGLAGHWRTGEAAREPAVRKFLGFEAEQQIIAFLYLGYPEGIQEAPERPGFADRTVWID
jgi:nitroreductase